MILRSVEFDPKTHLAQCESCGLIFELFGVPVDVSPESRPIARKREKVPLPKNVYAELHDPVPAAGGAMKASAMVPYREAANAIVEASDPDAKRLVRNNARAFLRIDGVSERHNVSIFYLVFFGGLLGLLEWSCISVRPRTEAIIDFAIAFAILLGGFAIALVWYVLAAFLNSKTVTLENGVLRVRVGPIKMGGNHAIMAEDIVQIWTRQTVEIHRNKGSTYRQIAYNVELQLKQGGEPLVLLRDLREQEQALYIEQTLEHALGIIDVAVVDEENRDAFLR